MVEEMMPLAAAMSGQGGPMDAMPGSAGGEAVAQSQVAQAGLAAWKQIQSMGAGARPEGDLMKALIMYVLTEGMEAPEAVAITQYLEAHGVKLPGREGPVGMDDEEPVASTEDME